MKLAKNTTFYKFYFYAVLLLLIIFPFHRVGSTIPVVILSLFFIVDTLFNHKKTLQILTNNKFILFCFFYLILCSLSFYKAENFKEFIDKEKLKLLFLIVPLIVFSLKNEIQEKWQLVVKTHMISSFSAVLFFIATAFLNYEQLGSNAFLYSQLVSITFVNPIVYAIVLNINIVFAFFFLENKILKTIYIATCSIFIFLLLSKIGIFILLLVLVSFVILLIKKNKKLGVSLLFSIIILSIVFGPKFINSELVSRRINVFNYYLKNNNSKDLEKQFPRKIIFSSSRNIIKNNLFFGVGISNTKKALVGEYKKIGFQKGIISNYDAHNQFIETTVGLGIIGLLSLLIILGYLIHYSIKNNSWPLIYFVCIISIVFMVESFLESQMGVMSFLLYSSLLLIYKPKHQN